MRAPEELSAVVFEVWTDPETLATCVVYGSTYGNYTVDVYTGGERMFTENCPSLFVAMKIAEAMRRIEESCSPRYYVQTKAEPGATFDGDTFLRRYPACDGTTPHTPAC